MRANWRSLRELEALRAVIGAGTATAAARRLGVSQPAVSRALAQLETRLGKILFERDGGRLLPTAEALALNRELEPLFDSLSRLDDVGWSITSSEALRLAIPATLAHRFMASHIAGFLKLHPEQSVSLDVRGTDVLVPGIAEGRYHLGITDSEVRHNGVRVEPFLRSEGVCILPKDSPLAGRAVIRPEDLRGLPYVALTRRHSARAATDRIFADAGVERRIVVETATAVSAYQLVGAGLGVSVLNPFPVAQRAAGEVEIRPFEPRLPYLTSFVVSASTPLPAAGRAFLRHVRLNTAKTPHSELV